MTTTIDIAAIAAAVTEQRGREPYLESRQAITRAVVALGSHLDALTKARLFVACDIATREQVELVGATPVHERQAFPGTSCPYCKHGDIVLIEQGHERQWALSFDDGYSSGQITEEEVLTAHFHGIEDYSDDGDGEYFTRCSSCLVEFQQPDDEWEWD